MRQQRQLHPIARSAAPFAIVIGAIILRIVSLSDRPLWLDEAFSALYANLDLDTLIELRRRSTNPPLYHLLLGGWAELFGSTEAGLRSLSVVAGSISVILCYWLGRSIGGTATGLWAAGLLAINSMAVGYSQEARYYALLEALALAAAIALRRGMKSRSIGWFATYALMMSAFVWMHVSAWFVLAAHVTAVAWWARHKPAARQQRRRAAIRFGGAVIVVLISFIPWAGVLASQVETVLQEYWIQPPRWTAAFETLHAFVVPLDALRWPSVVLALIGVLLFFRLPRRGARDRKRTESLGSFDRSLLLAWAILPIAIPLLWSYVATPIFLVKYCLAAQPAILLLIGSQFARRRFWGPLLVAVLAAAHAPAPNRGLEVEPWRAAAWMIKLKAPADAPVYICQDYTYFALEYYLSERDITPVLAPGSKPSEFVEILPRPPMLYEDWLTELSQIESEAWVVLSRMRRGQPDSRLEAILEDVQVLGDAEVFDLQGDVDVVRFVRGK